MLRTCLLLIFISTTILSAQTQQNADRFGRLPQPPLNGRATTAPKAAAPDRQLAPDAGSYPVAIFSAGKQDFIGELRESVGLEIQEQCLLFTSRNEGGPDRVCMAMPEGMPLPKVTLDNVRTEVRALSGLEGKREHLYLMSDRLSLGYQFEVSDTPQSIQFDGLPLVKQEKVNVQDSEGGYLEVPVTVETDAGPVSLTAGKTETIRFGGKALRVFLHTSLLQIDGGSCGEGGYILRIVILGDSRA